MADQNKITNAHEAVKKVNDLIKGIKFAMLTTITDSGELHSRPMTTMEAEFDGDIWFFAARDSSPVKEVRREPNVNVAYVRDNTYVSLAGVGEIVTDVGRKKAMWDDALKAWFKDQGPESPEVVLIRVDAKDAEYWEGPPGGIANAISTLLVLVTGDESKAGENKVVEF